MRTTKIRKLPPLYLLKSALSYDPTTGKFIWIARKANKIKIGDVAGTLHPTGYLQLRFEKRILKLHRLAWYFHTGIDPVDMFIRNKNGDLTDNRFSNLEALTCSDVALRRKVRITNTLGATGIQLENNQYRAAINQKGTRYDLGLYPTIEEAKDAYFAKREELIGV